MESFEISLSPQQFAQLSGTNSNITGLLNGLFVPGSDNYRKLAFELQREFRQGGSPDVTRITFDRIKYDGAAGKGSFRVVADIRFTFGCEDSVTEKRDQTSEWTFVVDGTRETIAFYSSPFAEGRSTADEF